MRYAVLAIFIAGGLGLFLLVRATQPPRTIPGSVIDSYYKNTIYGFSFDIPLTWDVEVDERVVDEETGEVNVDFVFTTEEEEQGGVTLIIYPNPEQLELRAWLDATFDEFQEKGQFPYDLMYEEPRIKLGNAAESIRVIGFPKQGYAPAYLTFAGNYYTAGASVYRFLWIDRGSDLFVPLTKTIESIEFF